MKKLHLLALILAAVIAAPSAAKTVYVNKNAPGPAHDGTSWVTAYLTVTGGLTAAASGDEVWVASGEYAEPEIRPGQGTSLYGGFAGTETERGQRDWNRNRSVLSGNRNAAAVSCHFVNTVVDGFTVRNGSNGVRIESGHATIANTNVSGNNVGVYVAPNAAATLSHNTVAGNLFGGVSSEGTVALEGNTVVGNVEIGVSVSSGTATLSNNTISRNDGTGVYVNGTATLRNNTLSGNSDAGMYIGSSAVGTLINNTLSGNATHGLHASGLTALSNNIIAFNGEIGVTIEGGGTITACSHNDVYGNAKGGYYGFNPGASGGNITVDPKLSHRDCLDLHIQPDSPCIDAGDDSVVEPGSSDIDGQPRTQSAHVDIGSDESDGTAWVATRRTLHVSVTGDDANDGLSWATSLRTVRSALVMAAGADEVWVAKGTFAESSLTLRSGVSLYGGFAGTETQRESRAVGAGPTILDGGGTNQAVVYGRFKDVVVDGLIIRNGNAGVEVTGTTTVANCTISENGGAYQGAGVSVSAGGQATIVNNTIFANKYGGVSVTDATAALFNNIIAFNVGRGLKSEGGHFTAFSHNDAYGNTTGQYFGFTPPSGQGNLSMDPKLFHNYNRSVHIQPDSPCKDAGDDVAVIGSADVDGQPRIQGVHVDIGSDESDGTDWVVTPRTWYVSETGHDANDGGSWGTARRTMESALGSALGHDAVWVARGTYAESITPPAGVFLCGGFAGTESEKSQRDIRSNPTVLIGSYDAPTIACRFPRIEVDGFTIRNGGVYVNAKDAVISNNTISGGYYSVYIDGEGAAKVSHNSISGGSTGVTVWGAATIAENAICGVLGDGVYIWMGTTTLSNNTICSNRLSGVYVNTPAMARMTNNIVAANSYWGVGKDYGANISLFSHNNVFDNLQGDYHQYTPPAGQGNTNLDPLIVDPTAGNFRLTETSPCIDAGDDSVVATGALDLDGKPRLIGPHVDMGAYEYGDAGLLPFTVADVSRCLGIVGGLFAGSADDLTRLNVESGSASLDLLDVLRLARKVAGLEVNP